jgi:long-chain acyl-CoA synthetase
MAMGKSWSYEELHQRVLAVASRLQQEGVKKGDHLAILAENSPSWGLAWLAIVRLGAIAVPVLPEMPEGDVQHILREMKVKAVFTTRRQFDKLVSIADNLHGPVFTFDDFREKLETLKTTPFSEYVSEALAMFKGKKTEFPPVEEEDMASIIYTSGTSGYSKAVMLTHRNFTMNACSASGLAVLPERSTWLSILPMSHTYEFTCGFLLPMIFGARVAYIDKLPTPAVLQKLCRYEKPTVIFAVPLVLEKIYKKKVLPEMEKGLMRLACSIGLLRRIICRRIGKKIIDFFGGKLVFMGVGGAKMNPDVEKFFYDAKFPYLIGYGMTEAAPLIAGGPLFDPGIEVGSTGRPIPGVEVRIENPGPQTGIGEIMVRGENVMHGYYDDLESTGEVLREGWLSTGDVGKFDKKGNLYVTGRLKNVIVMPNGENVYPEAIEHKIETFPLVADVLVLEHEGQLEAWAFPDCEQLEREYPEMTGEEQRALVKEQLETLRREVNAQLSKTAHLVHIYEKSEPFIKTATMKIKRYLYDDMTMRREEHR